MNLNISNYTILTLIFFSNTLFTKAQYSTYPWLKDNYNYIQFFDRNDLKSAFFAWSNTNNETFVVLHLGDSHLQNENLPNKTRTLAQQILGDGGIGLIEPFSIVNTYDAKFYFSKHTGIWEYSKSNTIPPKLPLGVRGMTAITYDENASFSISFSKSISEANNLLTLFCSNNDSSFVPVIYCDDIKANPIRSNGEIREYAIPIVHKTITLKLSKTDLTQNHFMIYGMSISNKNNVGCIWHNAGVGASQYKSILYEEKYTEQTRYLNPNLVIIDFGTNDFIYKNVIPGDLEVEIIRVIEKVREASPKASIILTSAQDMNYKKQNITASKPFSVLMKKIASENHCGFWDWYNVSGGAITMKYWAINKLAMNDGIHLNGLGSELKGTLLFQALEKTQSLYMNDTNLTNFQIENKP